MKTEEIIQRDPVDRMAALVTSRAPESCRWSFEKSQQQMRFTEQLRTALARPQPPRDVKDRRGFKFGRLTVVAYSHDGRQHKAKGAVKSHGRRRFWVVRCSCGNFEMRSLESIQRASPESMCEECNRVRNLNHHFEWEKNQRK